MGTYGPTSASLYARNPLNSWEQPRQKAEQLPPNFSSNQSIQQQQHMSPLFYSLFTLKIIPLPIRLEVLLEFSTDAKSQRSNDEMYLYLLGAHLTVFVDTDVDLFYEA